MRRRKKTLFEKVIDFINKESKNKEGEDPMYYSPYQPPPYIISPQQGGIDPFAFHKFVTEELDKQKKEAEEKKKRDESKVKWPFNQKFTLLQTVLITMTIGLVGGWMQLQLLYAFKTALLRTIQ